MTNKRTVAAIRRLHEAHAMPRKRARQANVVPAARDHRLCVCDSYLKEAHHHCEGCGFTIHHTERLCGECLCEQDGQ